MRSKKYAKWLVVFMLMAFLPACGGSDMLTPTPSPANTATIAAPIITPTTTSTPVVVNGILLPQHATPNPNVPNITDWEPMPGEWGNTTFHYGMTFGAAQTFVSPSKLAEFREYMANNTLVSADILVAYNFSDIYTCDGINQGKQYPDGKYLTQLNWESVAVHWVLPRFEGQNLNEKTVRDQFYIELASQMTYVVEHEALHIEHQINDVDEGPVPEATARTFEHEVGLLIPTMFKLTDPTPEMLAFMPTDIQSKIMEDGEINYQKLWDYWKVEVTRACPLLEN